MGIALFAYMDGQTYRSKTITGVVVGATAAGTSAVFKVGTFFPPLFYFHFHSATQTQRIHLYHRRSSTRRCSTTLTGEPLFIIITFAENS